MPIATQQSSHRVTMQMATHNTLSEVEYLYVNCLYVIVIILRD